MVRVCVIGGGVIGLETAVELARRGVDEVVLLEADHLAAGSSGLSIGVIESQYIDPLEIAVRVRALRAFDRLERDHALEIVRTGYLRLAHHPQERAGFERSVEVHRALGVDDVRVLEPHEIRALAPDMRVDDVDAGLWGPGAGFVDGHAYCHVLGGIAKQLGVDVRTRTRVLGAGRGTSGAHVLATSRGEVACDRVVIAAGPWGARVAALFGVAMALVPQRHEAVVVHLPAPLAYVMPMVMDYTPRTGMVGLYFRHERPGQLIAGLHSEEQTEAAADPDAYARSASQEFVEGVAERLASRLPALALSRLAHGWAGLYPVSPDGLPQVGAAREDPTVILAGGAGGTGIQQGPVLGELAADWVLHGEPRVLDGALRFAPGRHGTDSA